MPIAINGNGSITGDAITFSNTVTATPIVTSGGVLSPFSMRNRIINGDMRIDQRNAGAAVTATGGVGVYPVDRFNTSISTGSCSAQQSAVAPVNFNNSLSVTVSSSGTPSASAQNTIQHVVEGFNAADWRWGTANAQGVTLSFWVRSSLTGTFAVAFQNVNYDRYYVATYTINAANTWEYKTITIPGDTSGTWNATNGSGVRLKFDLGYGSNFNTTAGAWGGGEYYSVSGAQKLVANAGATFYLTGVQLEVGSVATPFERRQYGQELALCERYCQTVAFNNYIGNGSGFYWSSAINFQTSMRAAPTFGAFSGGQTGNISFEAPENITAQGCRYTILATGQNAYGVGRSALASAEL